MKPQKREWKINNSGNSIWCEIVCVWLCENNKRKKGMEFVGVRMVGLVVNQTDIALDSHQM